MKMYINIIIFVFLSTQALGLEPGPQPENHINNSFVNDRFYDAMELQSTSFSRNTAKIAGQYAADSSIRLWRNKLGRPILFGRFVKVDREQGKRVVSIENFRYHNNHNPIMSKKAFYDIPAPSPTLIKKNKLTYYARMPQVDIYVTKLNVSMLSSDDAKLTQKLSKMAEKIDRYIVIHRRQEREKLRFFTKLTEKERIIVAKTFVSIVVDNIDIVYRDTLNPFVASKILYVYTRCTGTPEMDKCTDAIVAKREQTNVDSLSEDEVRIITISLLEADTKRDIENLAVHYIMTLHRSPRIFR